MIIQMMPMIPMAISPKKSLLAAERGRIPLRSWAMLARENCKRWRWAPTQSACARRAISPFPPPSSRLRVSRWAPHNRSPRRRLATPPADRKPRLWSSCSRPKAATVARLRIAGCRRSFLPNLNPLPRMQERWRWRSMSITGTGWDGAIASPRRSSRNANTMKWKRTAPRSSIRRRCWCRGMRLLTGNPARRPTRLPRRCAGRRARPFRST